MHQVGGADGRWLVLPRQQHRLHRLTVAFKGFGIRTRLGPVESGEGFHHLVNRIDRPIAAMDQHEAGWLTEHRRTSGLAQRQHHRAGAHHAGEWILRAFLDETAGVLQRVALFAVLDPTEVVDFIHRG